jgi:cation diffusion facilitator CzcD-associated flavoprotein CzcO
LAAAADSTDLLIIGAGPFGLALASYAEHLRIRYVIVGDPMSFWREHMPPGMYLRSACDWHYDAQNVDTIEAYLATQGKTPNDVEPLSLECYLGYPAWFIDRRGIKPVSKIVTALNAAPGGRYSVVFGDGTSMAAANVVVAVGFAEFPAIPPDIAAMLPRGRHTHTRDAVALEAYEGKRVLIIGGRQSAFEWAALLAEAGARTVHVSYRHDTPTFERSDWSWVEPLMAEMIDDPGWFRSLSPDEKQRLSRQFWSEGRLKLEPWLAPRLAVGAIRMMPNTRVIGASASASGGVDVGFDSGDRIEVDEIIFATGYAVDIARVPFLANGTALAQVDVRDGFAALDTTFQTSSKGLFITSMPATRDFGPFFGFTVAVRASAKIIGDEVAARLAAER